MRILLPIEYYREGGVKRVIVSLTSKLADHVDKIIILVFPSQLKSFQEILPPSETIVYETFPLEPHSKEAQKLKILRGSARVADKLKLRKLADFLSFKNSRLAIRYRIEQLIEKHQIDTCFYPIIDKIEPPVLSIPLAGMVHDVFWESSPLTYADSYREKYNNNLKNWLDRASLLVSVSEKTRLDVLKIFPNNHSYAGKIKTILHAGNQIPSPENEHKPERPGEIIFYYPSSFGVYKDHLTLLKATVKLAQKNYRFKLILSGVETDSLSAGTITLSQQSSTKEYQDYIADCNRLFAENQEFIREYVTGLGYCEYPEVEESYRICSCVVMPSKYEGYGLAVSEALILGIPVIASDLEVFKEQVELYQCRDRVEFFPAGDEEALASYMEKFIENPKPRLSPTELSRNGKLWTWDDVAREYAKAFRSLSSEV